MQYRKDGRWHTVYYLYDGEGNVRQLINSRGQIIATYNYLPFGVIINKGMRGQGIEGNEGIGMIWGRENGLRNTITYQGREYDRDAGLYYYRARYQDPRLGRFLEVDPLLREVPEYTAGNTLPTYGNSGCGCGGNSANQNNNNNLINVYSPISNSIFPPIYIFVDNNPVNYMDPTGLWCITYYKHETVMFSGKQTIQSPSFTTSLISGTYFEFDCIWKAQIRRVGWFIKTIETKQLCYTKCKSWHTKVTFKNVWTWGSDTIWKRTEHLVNLPFWLRNKISLKRECNPFAPSWWKNLGPP